MPGAPGMRVDAEGGELAGLGGGVRVLARPDGGEPDDLVSRARDQQAGAPRRGASSERRQALAKACGSKVSSACTGTTSAYASRQTTAWTMPTAGASLSRASRTLASASGPAGSCEWSCEAWSCEGSWGSARHPAILSRDPRI